ncbi:hypothetical protein JTB14_022428 [Gonioctena quinquepunctata]|nr:hypothetical protein JTB14_022428 [Gonioctena quinquepunctata]
MCKFFKFSKDPQLKKKWILLVRVLERTYDQPQPSSSSQCLTYSVPAPEQLEPQPSTSYEDSSSLGTDFVEVEYVPEPDPQPSTSQNLAGFRTVLVEAENYFSQQELLRKKKNISKLKERMSFDHIKNNESLVLLYTGLSNATVFGSILELLRGVEFKNYYNWKVEKSNQADQLLLTLMKLRQNFPQLDLAQRFNISQASVSYIIITWVHVLQEVLFEKLMTKISERK